MAKIIINRVSGDAKKLKKGCVAANAVLIMSSEWYGLSEKLGAIVPFMNSEWHGLFDQFGAVAPIMSSGGRCL